MANKRLSTRKLAAATRKVDGKGVAYQTIGNIRRGDDEASPRVLALISEAAGVGANYFAEVRLAHARDQLDEREVGLENALANLAAIQATSEPPADDRPDGSLRPGEQLARDVRDQPPTPEAPEQPSAPAKGRRRSA